MSKEYLKIYNRAEDLAIKNSNLIEIVHGYCEAKMGEECQTDVLLDALDIIKENQSELVNEMDKSGTEFTSLLLKQGLL